MNNLLLYIEEINLEVLSDLFRFLCYVRNFTLPEFLKSTKCEFYAYLYNIFELCDNSYHDAQQKEAK